MTKVILFANSVSKQWGKLYHERRAEWMLVTLARSKDSLLYEAREKIVTTHDHTIE